MGRPTRDAQRRYMQSYRSDPLAAEIHRWSTRTARAAQRELARRHPGEYARILFGIREADPRPEPAVAEGASEHAA
jgi:hypothetical protein